MQSFETIIQQLYEKNWCVIENFLPNEVTQQLLLEAQEQQAQFKQAGIGQKNNLKINEKVRSDQILWLDEETALSASKIYLEHINKLRLKLNEELMLGLFESEIHFAIYPEGSFYQKHVDQFQNSNRRQVSFIYYLNPDWQESDGGSLKLYDPEHPENLSTEILPCAGTFACFLSNGMPHEVCLTNRTRYSITGWFLTRT